MDKILIKDLRVSGILGINPEERINKQDILINVVMFTDVRQAADSEDIEHAVNYKTISDRIVDRVENGSDLLVERLVTDLARIIVTEFGVERVRVRVEKPNALQLAASVGAEIERTQADFA